MYLAWGEEVGVLRVHQGKEEEEGAVPHLDREGEEAVVGEQHQVPVEEEERPQEEPDLHSALPLDGYATEEDTCKWPNDNIIHITKW